MNFKPPFNQLNGSGVSRFSWNEIIHAALTVGRANLKHVLMYGKYSQYELVYRAAVIYANLKQGQSRHLRRSDAYYSLDPSEKSAVSYYLGLTTAKLFAEKYLNVPWLMHLDVYKNNFTLEFDRQSKSRSDLIGYDLSRDWFVMEAKGRTNSLEGNLISKAKQQTQKLHAINRKSPKLRVALACYFERELLHVHWEDPEDGEENYPSLELGEFDFFRNRSYAVASNSYQGRAR